MTGSASIRSLLAAAGVAAGPGVPAGRYRVVLRAVTHERVLRALVAEHCELTVRLHAVPDHPHLRAAVAVGMDLPELVVGGSAELTPAGPVRIVGWLDRRAHSVQAVFDALDVPGASCEATLRHERRAWWVTIAKTAAHDR